ncbi:hypothetical protein BH20ACT5_BH20ACT5_06850 [soil metagenome]
MSPATRRAPAVLLAGALVAVLALAGWLIGVAAGSTNEQAQGRCTISGTPYSFDTAQAANAATIAAVGRERGIGDRGITIALATALQESKLRNLDYGDRDSLGLFQQRPSQGWGTPEQVQDPRYAATAFYDEMLTVPDWEQGRLTDVAQAVQRSGFPEAYQQWESDAQALTGALGGQVAALSCRIPDDALPAELAPDATAEVLAAVDADLSPEIVSATADGVALAAGTTPWITASWLVAHAERLGIFAVGHGGQRWTPDGGWQPDAGVGSDLVTAELA